MFIKNDWAGYFESEFAKAYMQDLFAFLKQDYEENIVYPPKASVFSAFHLTPYGKVKVVILGQDPYHGRDQANGLSFSVNDGVMFPPSLRNIFGELVTDIGCQMPRSGDLSQWASRGVMLLNTTLTVRAGSPMSHTGKGWEQFTDWVLQMINAKTDPVVFILWGRHAQSKIKLIDQSKHLVLTSAHPSPLSAHRGFFGSKPFSKTNEFLASKGLERINWELS